LLSLAIMAIASEVFRPIGVSVATLPQVVLPVAVVLGKLGLAIALLGIFAATFGAAIETGLSAGYTLAQYLGWQWGKYVRPKDAPRFHLVVLMSIVLGALFLLAGPDPVKVTEYSIVLSAAALPLTYFPIVVVANDPDYMGEFVNGRFLNAIAMFYLVLLTLIAVATIPLMIITKGGA
jgi:Mn2+/Fe2+ NRAMP family transporter